MTDSRINITAYDADYKKWFWNNESNSWVETADKATNFKAHEIGAGHNRVNVHERTQDLCDRMISIHTEGL